MTAVWTAPRTWVNNELVDETIMNQHVRDNMNWLKAPPQASADITTLVSLTTTTFADILTLASITTTGGPLLVGFHGMATCSAAIGASILGFDVTMDGTSVGGGSGTFEVSSIGGGLFINCSFALYIPTVSAAAHVLKLRGKISAGTASVYGSGSGFLGRFFAREI